VIVVSDTTPLISLMKVSLLNILYDLFGEIRIPAAVYKELTSNENFSFEAAEIQSSVFIKVVTIEDQKIVEVLQKASGLDLGESEAIAYADIVKADFLLMDEVRGRRVARSMGLQIMGTVGVMLAAFNDGILSKKEVENALDGLKKANRRIGDDVIEAAKRRL
jgi:predicted nucleic acid-binding protein